MCWVSGGVIPVEPTTHLLPPSGCLQNQDMNRGVCVVRGFGKISVLGAAVAIFNQCGMLDGPKDC